VHRAFSPKRHGFRREFEQRDGQLTLSHASEGNAAIYDIIF
jgi:hypothetical protein